VRGYITEFQTISSNLEWDEDALMDKFKGSLKQNILSLLIYYPSKPRNLDELFERAQELTENQLTRKAERILIGRSSGMIASETIQEEIEMEMSR
jgi:hypothetical protein